MEAKMEYFTLDVFVFFGECVVVAWLVVLFLSILYIHGMENRDRNLR